MKPDEIFSAMSEISQDYLNESTVSREHKRKIPVLFKIVSVAVCVCLIITAALFIPNDKMPEFSGNGKVFAIETSYPDVPQYPTEETYNKDAAEYYSQHNEWENHNRSVNSNPLANNKGLENYYKKSITEFLKPVKDDNAVYSPFSIYMALSMLAETTDGNSQKQILALFGFKNTIELRQKTKALWLANYRDDGITKSLFSNSIWLSDKVEFKTDTLSILKDDYFTSSYCGDVTDNDFFNTYKNWINTQTDGLLKNQVEGLKKFDSDTIFSIANTVYFSADWHKQFAASSNKNDIFYSPQGKEECEFMFERGEQDYYWGENFSAVTKKIKNYGKMLFILPDEGVKVNSLLSDEETLDLLLDVENYENNCGAMVNLSVPKFDLSSDYDIIDSIKNMGITDVFDPFVSDFSSITDEDGLSVSDARHAARVLIDEDGCLGAAFTTVTVYKLSEMPGAEKEIDFTLNRPFIFAVLSDVGTPLFIGIVNNPA